MNTNAIGAIGSNTGRGVLSAQEAEFGENPFLSLLITQLRNQTPLEPVDNDSFMQQMATYSSMEEQKELNDNMLQLLNFQGVLARLQGLSEASTMLGKKVTFAVGENQTRAGVVESIFVNEQGEVRLRIGEDEVGMSQITGIEEPEAKKDEGDDGGDKKKDDGKDNGKDD